MDLIQKYWKDIILVLLGFSFASGWLYHNNSLEDVIAIADARYKEEKDLLEKAHKRELEERDEALEAYERVVASLEKQYLRRIEQLERERDKRQGEIARIRKNKPEELRAIIEDEFGFEYVE